MKICWASVGETAWLVGTAHSNQRMYNFFDRREYDVSIGGHSCTPLAILIESHQDLEKESTQDVMHILGLLGWAAERRPGHQRQDTRF